METGSHIPTDVYSKPKLVWHNIIFFTFTALVALFGAPWYWMQHGGISTATVILMAVYLVGTGLGITAGYHRLFSHAAYKAHPFVEFLYLFFGGAAFEMSALEWSAQHRDHHRYVDTDRDPYSIKKGFWYAHIGWILFWVHRIDLDTVKDLQKKPLLMFQHKYYIPWAIVTSVIIPTLIGAAYGRALEAFIFAVCVRLAFVHHATFCINSVCHMFGKSTFDRFATAKDHWFVALVTYGEGYHNFHHRFPSDYRNGIRWYHWDPSKWLIALLSKARLAWDLKTISSFRILDAKLKSDLARVHDWLAQSGSAEQMKSYARTLEACFSDLSSRLDKWEKEAKKTELTSAKRKVALARVKVSGRRFKTKIGEWRALLKKEPALEACL